MSDTRCSANPTLGDVASYFDDIGKLLPRGHTAGYYAATVRLANELLGRCEREIEARNQIPMKVGDSASRCRCCDQYYPQHDAGCYVLRLLADIRAIRGGANVQ